jgi:hypothetical protein
LKTDLTVRAYAADCVVTGILSLQGERLTDFLADRREYEFRDAELEALDDGRIVPIAAITIPDDEVLAVVGVGPRGSSSHRLRTRPHPVLIGIGPYEVGGYLHAPPTADPVTTALRRRFVPLTDGFVRRPLHGRVIAVRHETIILNRSQIAWVEGATSEQLGIIQLPEIPGRVDARAKDLTPELSAYRRLER